MESKGINWIRLSLLILIVVAVVSNPIFAKPEGHLSIEDRLDDYISKSIRQLNIPAASIAISKGNSVIYNRSFGDGVDNNTRYYIGSISKSFTGLAIAQLVEQGLIDLNKPVSYYIEEFGVSDKITVRHLLHHVSGMEETQYNSFGSLDPSATFIDLVNDMNTMTLSSVPGKTFAYFNPNYSLLGFIIEKVTGLSYSEYIQSNIIDQLDLYHTSLDGGVDLDGHLSFFGFPIRRAEVYLNYDLPGGYITASSYDLLGFLDAIRNRDPRLGLSEKGFERLLGVYPRDGFYSMGLMHYPLGNRSAIHHGGSLPGFLANGIILPEEDISIAILINNNHMLLATVFQPSLTNGIISILTDRHPSRVMGYYWLYRAFLIAMVLVLALNIRKFRNMLRSKNTVPIKKRLRSIVFNLGIAIGLMLLIPFIASILFPKRGFDLEIAFLLMPDFLVFMIIGLSIHFIEALIQGLLIIRHRRQKSIG